ncbi:hypothetical protein GCM10022398_23160 [Acetobacter lovaniensis]|nr:hypothetical protein AA0474_0517 [Acetobacter lovaniensis NRIC 0474]
MGRGDAGSMVWMKLRNMTVRLNVRRARVATPYSPMRQTGREGRPYGRLSFVGVSLVTGLWARHILARVFWHKALVL